MDQLHELVYAVTSCMEFANRGDESRHMIFFLNVIIIALDMITEEILDGDIEISDELFRLILTDVTQLRRHLNQHLSNVDRAMYGE